MTTTSTATAPADTTTRYAWGRDLLSNVWVLIALVGFQAYVVAAGLPAWHAVLASAGVLITQVFPGALIWRTIRPRNGWLLEDLFMGFAMGICVAVPAQIIAGLLHSRIPAIVLPLLVAAILLAVPVTRRRIQEAQWSPLPWWFGFGVSLTALAFLTGLINYSRTNRLHWGSGAGSPQVDTYLHMALAAELLQRGPVEWPTVKGATLGYQWFTHAWIAHVTAVSGVPLDEVLMRFMPALMPIVAVVSVAVLGLRLSGSPVVGVVSAVGSTVLGQGSVFGLSNPALPLTPLSPTVGLAIAPLMAFIAVLAMRWRGQARSGAWIALPLLTCISTGLKGSAGPIVVAGMALAILAMAIWHRRLVLPVIADLVTVGVTLGLTMIVVYRGSAAGLAFDPAAGATQTALGRLLGGVPTWKMQVVAAATAFAAGMTRALFAFALPFRTEDRRDPLTWVLIGSAIAGAAPVALFYHPGASQYYFLMTAIPLAAVGSALGAWRVYHALRPRERWIVGGVGLVGAALFYFVPVWLTGGQVGHHQLRKAVTQIAIGVVIVIVCAAVAWFAARHRRVVTAAATAAAVVALSGAFGVAKYYEHGLPIWRIPPAVSIMSQSAVTDDQIAVARYIRDHSDVDDLVMTNRHCTTPIKPDHCDTRRWLVTAFTERQSFIEGWTATPEATNLAPHGRDSITINYWHPELLELNDNFYTNPTAEAQRKLWDEGVRWIYMENTMPHAETLAPYATLRFSTPDASAWQLNKPAG
ncbi:hypothetical protein ATK17_0237 [Branchiibius hedensis]|uniref:4-amino-4-deoxy-L-arabinose transferase n=1 Tax=Branchiibius hedensis TaxID=672460 RepID=A0A2Y8ZST4_9MICO|nr:hypothetical protein [Branchiibius hedensis]PWJ24149.1 hypothetical protein ATK17_0237 [Branchiibius hedensis]SSA32967.1 hypothetical protein SAMN04489750_0237 [Branchiibius hedensis]